jgi:hypothetical protein
VEERGPDHLRDPGGPVQQGGEAGHGRGWKDTKRIFDAVSTAAELSKPGMGIGYVTPIGEVSGVAENTAAKTPHALSGCADSFR